MSDLAALERAFETKGTVLVALSGGVDSSTLAAVAHRALGDDAVAVTFRTETVPKRDLDDARAIAAGLGIDHRIVAYSELASPEYRTNDPDRCYHCRRMLADQLEAVQEDVGAAHAAAGILPGDLDDHSPGIAALREAGVWFPYVELGLTKDRVRRIAAELDLAVSDKPTDACLSSRIPYGEPVTEDKLQQVRDAERALRDLGFSGLRVRHHGDLARIEVRPHDRDRLLDHAREVTRRLREAGFTWVSMDLVGYRTGAMNESLPVLN